MSEETLQEGGPEVTGDEPVNESEMSAEEIKKAKIRAAKAKAKAMAKAKLQSKKTGNEFDLKGKKRFEVKKWNAVALWSWGMYLIFLNENRIKNYKLKTIGMNWNEFE